LTATLERKGRYEGEERKKHKWANKSKKEVGADRTWEAGEKSGRKAWKTLKSRSRRGVREWISQKGWEAVRNGK